MADLKKFDPSKLDELKEYKDEHNRDLRFSLVDSYLTEARNQIEQMKKSTDLKSMSAVAHSLKSSTASLGGVELSKTLYDIEQQKFNPQQKEQVLLNIEKLFSEFETFLKSYLKTAA